MTARLTVLSGPSGVGKGTVVGYLRRHHPQIWVSTSVTTRPPRAEETDGIEYHFLSERQFTRLVAEEALLEHASYAGHRYGTPRSPVQHRVAGGLPALLEIDLQGARQEREQMPSARLVFLAPPSLAELERRLVARGTESPEVVRQRLQTAKEELAAVGEFDDVVVNSSVPEAAERLVALLAV
jgi:guanylate kinase